MTDEDLKKIAKLIDVKLEPINNQLSNLETGLAALAKKIDHPETGLIGLNEKMDVVISEVHEIRLLANITNEKVDFINEKYERETKTIKKHLGLIPN